MYPFITLYNLLYKSRSFIGGRFMAIPESGSGKCPHVRDLVLILEAILLPVPESVQAPFGPCKVDTYRDRHTPVDHGFYLLIVHRPVCLVRRIIVNPVPLDGKIYRIQPVFGCHPDKLPLMIPLVTEIEEHQPDVPLPVLHLSECGVSRAPAYCHDTP